VGNNPKKPQFLQNKNGKNGGDEGKKHLQKKEASI